MKRYITAFALGLCLAVPMLSQASDIKPFMHVTNVHNGQYDTALDAITDTKFYGPYQFRVLKDAIETQGETKDIDGRVFRTSDGVFMHVKARSIDNGSASLDLSLRHILLLKIKCQIRLIKQRWLLNMMVLVKVTGEK